MQKVKEFHEKMELAIDQPFSKELLELRMRLIFEEVQELAEVGLDLEGNLDQEERHVLMQDFLKEMCDVIYVIKGTAVSFGMDLNKAYNLVHKSNMSKFPFTKDEHGKVLKGKNYKPPVLEDCV
jgi:predicted HAD superfamily Cof-like phosphohydrolase